MVLRNVGKTSDFCTETKLRGVLKCFTNKKLCLWLTLVCIISICQPVSADAVTNNRKSHITFDSAISIVNVPPFREMKIFIQNQCVQRLREMFIVYGSYPPVVFFLLFNYLFFNNEISFHLQLSDNHLRSLPIMN